MGSDLSHGTVVNEIDFNINNINLILLYQLRKCFIQSCDDNWVAT